MDNGVSILEKERQELATKLTWLDDLIARHKSNGITKPDNNKGTTVTVNDAVNAYPFAKPVQDRALFILKREGRFLHTREIATLMVEMEGGEIDEIVAKLSPRLSKLKNKEGVITNIQIGSSLRNTFWGSKKWLNIDNSVKSEHMYKEDYLLDKINPKREL